MVQAIQALRGVSLIVAAVIVAEVGSFSRFDNPRQLMAYLGLNPSEHSSGATIRRGAITKTGNALARTCLVEAAWTYRFPARVTQIIRNRLKDLPEPIRNVAWKAQVRLSARYRKLIARRQADTQGSLRDRARTGRLHLGDRSHGRAEVRLTANEQGLASKEVSSDRRQSSAPSADGRMGRLGNPRSGLEQASEPTHVR